MGYNKNTKEAGVNKFLAGAGALGTLGALYGIGDTEHNNANNVLHPSTGYRTAQGALSGLAGVGGYKVLRGLGKGRLMAGLAGLLSAGGAAALANPKLKEEDPYKLPF
tara:strand:+ start:290 stop:613 length:324 start_codon:yes stop_codon:yes gene_type:complete